MSGYDERPDWATPSTLDDGPAGSYVPVFQTYRLEFGPDYPRPEMRGLWVRVRSAPLGVVLQHGLGQVSAVQVFRDFGACIEGWNITTPSGAPVSADVDGLMALPEPLALQLLREWQAALTEVPAPLARPSIGGAAPTPPMPLSMEPNSRVS